MRETAADVTGALRSRASVKKARALSRFFKTGIGEYAEGDMFLGVMVPQTRAVVAKYKDLPEPEITELLASKYHEVRLAGLLILVDQFARGDNKIQARITKYYLRHVRAVNNWDLVDLSAHKILGEYLQGKSLAPLVRLARSRNMWERRIAMIATFAHLQRGNSTPTFRIALMLLGDKEDLIHKAVGWALREVGKKKGERVVESFLRTHYQRIPRTTLRYAIERFQERKRKALLSGVISSSRE